MARPPITDPRTDAILLVARELCGIREQLVKQNDNNAVLTRLAEMEKRIMAMTSTQLDEALDKMTAQTGKIALEQSTRFDALTEAIEELNAVIASGGSVTPATEAKQAALQVALDNLDAAIPDAPKQPA